MTVYEPTTLAALVAALEEDPEALLVAGGTQVMRSPVRHADRHLLISLRRVEPLSRVSRTQRFLDIGATVPLTRVLSIGPRVVPRTLFAALKATASPTVRVLATLGGNICAPGVEHTSLAALGVLNAVLELRRGTAIRTVPAVLFWRGGDDRALQAGEVLVRVRLPLEEFEVEQFVEQAVHWRGTTARLSFAAVAGLRKDAVEELRLCCSSPWFGTLRFGDFESACSGVRLPIREKTVEELVSMLRRALVQRLGAPIPETAPLLAPVIRQAARFLGLLGEGGRNPLEARRRDRDRPGRLR